MMEREGNNRIFAWVRGIVLRSLLWEKDDTVVSGKLLAVDKF